MPNLVATVVEMLKRGMSEQEIKQNLQELGVDDADSVYSQAVAAQKNASPETTPASPSITKLAAEMPVPTVSVDTEKLELKIESLETEVKALNELMNKILDTERQILLRLKE